MDRSQAVRVSAVPELPEIVPTPAPRTLFAIDGARLISSSEQGHRTRAQIDLLEPEARTHRATSKLAVFTVTPTDDPSIPTQRAGVEGTACYAGRVSYACEHRWRDGSVGKSRADLSERVVSPASYASV
jgi:hypothetical protein